MLIENLDTLAQAEATLADLQSYLETVQTTAVSGASITELLTGEYLETLLTTITSEAGAYDYYKKTGMAEALVVFKLGASRNFEFFQRESDLKLTALDRNFALAKGSLAFLWAGQPLEFTIERS
jgi:hypothetical protein